MRDLSLTTPRKGERISHTYLSGLEALAAHNHVPVEGMVSRDGVVEVPREELRFRRFELKEELSGGAGVSVEAYRCSLNKTTKKWEATTSTMTVVSTRKNHCGLIGEQGTAQAIGGIWEIVENPGEPTYEGTANGDIASGATTASVNVPISGFGTQTITAKVLATITSGYKVASGDTVVVSHTEGQWKIIAHTVCEVAV